MELGSADEQKPTKVDTIEAWGRSDQNTAGVGMGLKRSSADPLGCTFRR